MSPLTSTLLLKNLLKSKQQILQQSNLWYLQQNIEFTVYLVHYPFPNSPQINLYFFSSKSAFHHFLSQTPTLNFSLTNKLMTSSLLLLFNNKHHHDIRLRPQVWQKSCRYSDDGMAPLVVYLDTFLQHINSPIYTCAYI